MISQSDDIINELNRATVFSHLIIFLVLAEDKDMDTDVDASNYVWLISLLTVFWNISPADLVPKLSLLYL